MVKAKLKYLLLLCYICIILVILAPIIGCSKKEKAIQVVHGRSIAGVELGMLEEQVIDILGEPSSQFSEEDMDKFGGVYDVSPEGKYEKVPLEEMEDKKILMYQNYLAIFIDKKDNKVIRLSLSYCENVFVQHYPFLKFKYLTQEELNRLGNPTAKYRMKEAEKTMMSKAPNGTIIEYYEYFYDTIGINLGLVFDRTKQKSSKYFIGVNHIDIYSTQK